MSNYISIKLLQSFAIVFLFCGLTISVNAQKTTTQQEISKKTNTSQSTEIKGPVNPIVIDFVIEDDIMQSNGEAGDTEDIKNNNDIVNINKFLNNKNTSKADENKTSSSSLIRLTNEIKVYPIPAVSFTNLDLGTVNASQLDIVNNLGQVVNSLQIKQQPFLRLDISNLNTGIYYLRINTSDSLVVTKTIVVQ